MVTSLAEFLEQLRSAFVIREDRYDIDAAALLALVGDSPPLTARAISQSLRLAQEQPRLFRVAEVLALVYRILCQDDVFEREVEARGRELGRKPAQIRAERNGATVLLTLPEFFAAGLDAAPQGDPDELLISRAELGALDVYPYVKRFSPKGRSATELVELKSLRGRHRLTFMIHDDSRDVVFIPEVRSFAAKLFATLPYLPYYLDLNPDAGMVPLLIGCLADPEAVVPVSGEGWDIDLTHPSVADFFTAAMAATARLAIDLDDDPSPVWRQLLSPLPPDVYNHVVERVKSASRVER